MTRAYEQREVSVDDVSYSPGYREEQGDIEELRQSIEAVGLLQPITVSKNGKLLAGRRRFVAAKAAGLSRLPALVMETEDELDEREIELFENLHRKNLTWQEQIKITARVHELMIEKHGEEWSKRKTAKLLGKAPSALTDAVEMSHAMTVMPELADAPTADKARRQLKRLVEEAVVSEAMSEAEDEVNEALKWADDHYCIGDALELMSKTGGEVANFAEVDPPYAINLDQLDREGSRTYNEIREADYPKFVRSTAQHVYRLLRQNSWCIWWHGPSWHCDVKRILLDVGFQVDDIPGIWHKVDTASQSGNPNVYLSRGYEPFFICRKGRPLLRKRGRSNVFSYPSPRANRIHPTERPTDLIKDILRTFCYPGATVLVPFLGSGNTLLAAYTVGMLGWGYDLSSEYKKSFLFRASELRIEPEPEDEEEEDELEELEG